MKGAFRRRQGCKAHFAAYVRTITPQLTSGYIGWIRPIIIFGPILRRIEYRKRLTGS